MTASAKELTVRATAEPTSSARDFLALLDAFVRLGFPRAALLSATGLDETRMEDPDARVPCSAGGTLFEAARRMRPMPNLGLAVATATPMGAYPLLDYLVLSCDSVGEGYRQLARYFRLVSPVGLEIEDGEEPIRVLLTGAPPPFLAEFTLSLAVLHLRRETQGRFAPASVSFVHRPDDIDAVRRTLGCEVFGEAGWNGVSVSRAAWNVPLSRRDPVLKAMLERQADERALPVPGGAAAEVRRLLLAQVAGGDMSIGSVARLLATAPRTLQRRLAREKTSYQDLVEGTRREAAEGYLAGSALSVGEIAYLLGYSEPAAFHRAFRRWNGVTPREFRESRRSGRVQV